MIRTTRTLLVFITAVVSTLCLAATANIVTAARDDDGTIKLFNGKDLTNFYTWLVDNHHDDPNRVFTVADAIDGGPAVRVSGQQYGAFITKQEYSNYHLVTEFRWGLLTWGGRT